MKTKNLFVIITGFLILSCSVATAQDWPQFLGTDRDSKSPQKGLLRSWPESGPEVLWSVPVGIGYGGPVVKAGKAYLLDRNDETGDIMRCFDLNTGAEVWKLAFNSPGEVSFPGSRSVPIVDDKHVYGSGLNGELYCVDLSGKLVWQKNIWKDFGGGAIPTWAISQCPVLYGDMLIVASQAPDAGVVAYNKNTGAVIWKTPNLGPVGYVSPKVLKIHGEDHVVYVTSSGRAPRGQNAAPPTMGNVVGLDPKTGNTLWMYSNWDCHIAVPCPVLADDNKLLIVGGYERGATMIQVNKKADGSFDTTELFTTLEFGDQTKPPLYHNGYFYALYRTNQKRDGMVCMDINGNIMWKTMRDPAFDRGSMILADGLILATDGLKTLYLIEPDHTGFKMISKADVLAEGGANTQGMSAVGGATQNWAPLALADGKLLVRDQAKMVCVKVVQ